MSRYNVYDEANKLKNDTIYKRIVIVAIFITTVTLILILFLKYQNTYQKENLTDNTKTLESIVPQSIISEYKQQNSSEVLIIIKRGNRTKIDLTNFSKGKTQANFNTPGKVIISKGTENIRFVSPGIKHIDGFDGKGIWFFSAEEYFKSHPHESFIEFFISFV